MFTREAFHSLYYMLNTGSKTDFRAKLKFYFNFYSQGNKNKRTQNTLLIKILLNNVP